MRTKTLLVLALLALAAPGLAGAEELTDWLPQQTSEPCLLQASPEVLNLDLDPTPALFCKSIGRSCQHDSQCCSGSCAGSGSNKTCA